jgi:hypothetical protein
LQVEVTLPDGWTQDGCDFCPSIGGIYALDRLSDYLWEYTDDEVCAFHAPFFDDDVYDFRILAAVGCIAETGKCQAIVTISLVDETETYYHAWSYRDNDAPKGASSWTLALPIETANYRFGVFLPFTPYPICTLGVYPDSITLELS